MRLSKLREKLRISGLFSRRGLKRPRLPGRDREAELRALFARSPFAITDIDDTALRLYDRALTHRSYTDGRRYSGIPVEDNERLEFLGNYVLDFIIAEHLYDAYNLPPGEMNRRLQVTRNTKLADIVLDQELGIDRAIRKKGQILTDSIIADAFEALIGSIFLDRGLDVVREIILAIFEDEIAECDTRRNYRGRLQEHVAKENLGPLAYDYCKTGPGNCPIWAARVTIDGILLGRGEERTKQKAAMLAAREALIRLGKE